MKFRFLGDGDCPDWLLAEINTLSRMTSIKMKMLGQLVAKSLTEGNLDLWTVTTSQMTKKIMPKVASLKIPTCQRRDVNLYAKYEMRRNNRVANTAVFRNISQEDRVRKLTQDAKLETGDAKAIVAALNLILTSSTSHAVSATDLNSELQQLGLPREHSTTLARLYTEHSPQITGKLSSHSLRIKRVSSIDTLEKESASPFVKMAFKIVDADGNEERNCLDIPKDQIPVLIAELKRARSLMEGL